MGNETADRLAKEGTNGEQKETQMSLQEAKTLFKGKFTQQWKLENDYCFKKDAMHRLPRKDQCALFRLRTGHCRLGTHAFKMGHSETAACECGERSQTVSHILQECPLLATTRQQLWPIEPSLHTKLWGIRTDLELTAEFIRLSGILA